MKRTILTVISGNAILQGDRIRLDAIRDDDLPLLARWLDDLGVQRLANPGIVTPITVLDLQDPEGWFEPERRSSNSYLFAVRTLADDTLIGMTALAHVHTQAHHAEFGINLANPAYQGKGYGADVSRVMLRYGFHELNLNRIYLRVFAYNPRAVHLYEKMGFRREVVQREMLYRDGRYYDQIIMGLLRSEWEAQP
jgi:RimJ/RimL family protein N-acetyltransferase